MADRLISMTDKRLARMLERLTWARRREMPAHYRAALEGNINRVRQEQDKRRKALQ